MDIVIAVYNENVDWIKKICSNRIFIYLKNETRYTEIKNKFPDANIEVLENIGRESHTYLYHICKYYNDISDTTVFLQGNPFDHCFNIIELINKSVPNTFFGLWVECDGNGNPDHCGLRVADVYTELFGETKHNFRFIAGAQFMISVDSIRKHSLEYYKILLNKHYNEYKFPWCIERYWSYIFV